MTVESKAYLVDGNRQRIFIADIEDFQPFEQGELLPFVEPIEPLECPKDRTFTMTCNVKIDKAELDKLMEALLKIIPIVDPNAIQQATLSLQAASERFRQIGVGCLPPIVLPDIPRLRAIDEETFKNQIRKIAKVVSEVRPSHPLSFPSPEISAWCRIYQIAEEARKYPFIPFGEIAMRFPPGGTETAMVSKEEPIISRKETSRHSELIDKIPAPKSYQRNRFKR